MGDYRYYSDCSSSVRKPLQVAVLLGLLGLAWCDVIATIAPRELTLDLTSSLGESDISALFSTPTVFLLALTIPVSLMHVYLMGLVFDAVAYLRRGTVQEDDKRRLAWERVLVLPFLHLGLSWLILSWPVAEWLKGVMLEGASKKTTG